MSSWETQMRKGVVELAVLASIAGGETYGYRIVEHLRKVEGLEFTESTVYPVLTRLARDGSLAIREESSPSGPTRRYYRLTEGGQARLSAMSASWRKVSRSLDTLLEGAPS
ncbi:MAG: PadR family transcriptional regulator [Isosphaeraceae bacterium]